MKTWDEMDSRQREAWIHQNVFGKNFWTEQRGEYTWVVSNDHDGRDPWCSSKYPKPERYSLIDCSEINPMVHCLPERLIPNYTTDASADYLVLMRVRETWKHMRGEKFSLRLGDLLFDAAQKFDGFPSWASYTVGMYSHAAYLALTATDSEKGTA